MNALEVKNLVIANYVGDVVTHERALAANLDPEIVFACDGVNEAIANGCLVYQDLSETKGYVWPLPTFDSFMKLCPEHYEMFKKFRAEYEGFVTEWLRAS